MPSVKILSDFDGVWTNQGLEADEVQRHIVEESARVLGETLATIESEIGEFERRMLDEPAAWGWAPDGERISAFADEDPLCRPSGLCMFIDHASLDALDRYRDALRAEFGSLAAFGEHCYRQSMATYRERHPPGIVPDAVEQLEAVRAAGAEVVVISNSPTSKISAWFQSAGIDAGEGPGHSLRLRGSAGKQTLGNTSESIEVGGRSIIVDRPRYRAAIEEENPDIIIGDVFSLDLALPHMMRTTGVESAPSRLVLRSHPHTPSWVLHSRADGAIDHVVEAFGDVARLLD